MDPPLEYRGPSGTSWNPIPAAARPPSVSELTQDALKGLVWNDELSVLYYLISVETCTREGETYMNKGDLEKAFVQFMRVAMLILALLPLHRDYYTSLTENGRKYLFLNCIQSLHKLADVQSVLENRYEKWLRKHTTRIPRVRAPNAQTWTNSDSVIDRYLSTVTPLQPPFQTVSSPRVQSRIEEFIAEERVPQQKREQRRRSAEQREMRTTRMDSASSLTTPSGSSSVVGNNRSGPSFTGVMMPLSTGRYRLQPDPPSAGDTHETSSSASDEYSEASSRTESTDYGIYCRRMAYEYAEEL